MREIALTVSAHGDIALSNGSMIGREGELNASRVAFDVSAWVDGAIGTYSIAGKNGAGVEWLLETGLTAVAGIVALDVPDALVSAEGYAEIEIRGESTGTIIKAAPFRLPVRAALTAGTAPEGADPAWIDRLSQAASGVARAADALAAQVGAAESGEAGRAAQAAKWDTIDVVVNDLGADAPSTGALVQTANGSTFVLGIRRGEKGETGDDATINGARAVEIAGSDYVQISQKDGVLTISADVRTKTTQMDNDAEFLSRKNAVAYIIAFGGF